MSVFDELKRRKVFRVGVAYLIMSWLIIQVVGAVSAPLNLPETLDTVVIVLLAVGLPVSLFLAWAFELTPDGIKRADEVGPESSIRQTTNQTVVARDKSIAVLPFVNLSSDKDQEYFSDGLAEEILNKLAQVSDLSVAARTSSFAFKGENPDLRKVGESLGVAYILEGSVRRSGDEIRITGQLIRADNGFHLWSATFDRRMDDIFAVQDEIAGAVTTALSITIGAGEFDLPGMTRNTVAWDEYLKGLSAFREYSPASFQNAIQSLRRATRIDPDFRLAWSMLGVFYAQALVVPGAGQSEALSAAAVSVLRDLEAIAPDDAGTAVLRSQVTFLIDRDLMGSRRQSLELVEQFADTDSALLVFAHASLARARLGYAKEAEELVRRGQEIDPSDGALQLMLCVSLIQQGRYDEAFEQTEIGLRFGEFETLLRALRTWIAHARRDFDAALVEARAAAALGWPVARNADGVLLDDLLATGDRDAVLDYLEAIAARDFADPRLAQYAGVIGKPELALRLWQPIETTRDLVNLWYPAMRDVRRLPEFKSLVDDIGLVEVWRTTGDWGDYCRPIAGTDDFECE